MARNMYIRRDNTPVNTIPFVPPAVATPTIVYLNKGTQVLDLQTPGVVAGWSHIVSVPGSAAAFDGYVPTNALSATVPAPATPARRTNGNRTSAPRTTPSRPNDWLVPVLTALGIIAAVLLVAAAIWFFGPWLMSLRPQPVVVTPPPAPVVCANAPTQQPGWVCSTDTVDGFVYRSAEPRTFSIPAGWDGYYGIPAGWQTEGVTPKITQISVYRDDPSHTVPAPSNPPANPPAAPANPPANPPANAAAPVAPNCPTLDEARKTFGLDFTLVGTETCAYTWTDPKGEYKDVTLKGNWMITTAERDGIYITEGNGSTVSAHAVTVRFMPANPGLTSDLQYKLEYDYAALPQNNFANLVKCRTCSTVSNAAGSSAAATPAASSASCPTFGGAQTTAIGDGGCLYKGATVTGTVPMGWKAYYGAPAQWYQEGSTITASQVSFYKK